MESGLEIVYEDEYLLGINKPAGLLTIRDGYDASLPYVARLLENDFGKLWTVHRLDRDTSGILLLARNSECHRILNTAFESRQVRKIYHAVVVGNPAWSETLAEMPLMVDGDRRHRTVVSSTSGKPARTELRVLQRRPDYSLIEAHPLTGYTHQIRAHLAALGFPILSDNLYGDKPKSTSAAAENSQTNVPISRLALHAFSIQFPHPVTTLEMSLSAPYPDDFKSALIQLF
jgi:RluA family pseudouridine synthase